LAGKQNPVVWEARGRLEDGGLRGGLVKGYDTSLS
jgi:hypothetical protein